MRGSGFCVMFESASRGLSAAGRLFGRSISRRVLGSLVAIYVVTYMATALVVYSSVRSAIVTSNANALHQLAQRRYEHLDSMFQTFAVNLTAWSQLEVMNDLVSGDIDKRISQALENARRLYGLAGDIYAFDARGRLVAGTRTSGSVRELPAVWQHNAKGLILLGKHRGPISGREMVALEVPVFGSFDRSLQIGLLVLTCPWSRIEALVSSSDAGIVLRTTGPSAHILAVDWRPLASSMHDNDMTRLASGGDRNAVIGMSLPGSGLIRSWQVVAIQRSGICRCSSVSVGGELLLLGLLLAVPIVGLGRWLSRRLTEPVVDLTRVVADIANTNKLDLRVPVSTDDELGALARAFNAMTEKLERAGAERDRFVLELGALNQTLETKVAERTRALEFAVESQQRLMRDISHEIKSPLARLSMALGLLRRSPGADLPKRHVDRIESEVENISKLASELLTLMSLDNLDHPMATGPVNIRSIIEEILADAVYEAPSRRGDISLSGPTHEALVAGDEKLLRRAIENVIRNALFYTAEGTPIEITIGATEAGQLHLAIADRGPGVSEEALGQLFEPFYRVDEARARKTGGSGIGLAICRRVVTLHAGTVQARRNEPHGLIVDIRLPLIGSDG